MRTDGILDARPLYFRLALESASNSIILVFSSFSPFRHRCTTCNFPMDLLCIHTRYRKRGRQTDRSSHFMIKGQRSPLTYSQKQKRTQYRVQRGFHDCRMIYRSFEYKRRNGSTVRSLESRESCSNSWVIAKRQMSKKFLERLSYQIEKFCSKNNLYVRPTFLN